MATDRLINSTQGDSIIGKLDDIKTAINNQSTAATAMPLMDGTAAVGTSTKYARENHVHPTDTSRAANVMSTYAIDTARENITTSSTVQGAIEQLEYREELNKNNILLLEEMNGAKNNLPVTLNSGQISDVTFTVNADKSISTSGTASANITNAYVNISYTIPSTGQWVLLGCPSGGSTSASGYRLDMLDGGISGTQVVADTGAGVVFDKTMFQSTTACVRLRIGNGANMNNKTFKPMIIPKAIYDAGFTDYQPYAMSNVELTEQKADASDVPLKLERYVANSSKTYTITAGRVYIITVNSYGTYGMFMAFKYSDETTPRLYEIKKSSSFDSLITVTAVANSSDISIAPVSSSTWFVSSGMKL